MRDIKFRGKRVDTGEWEYGYLLTTKKATYICYANQYNDDLFISPENIMISVIPETVGQFTGKKDKAGREIYEGDILKHSWDGEEIIDIIEFCPPMFTYRNSTRWSLELDKVIGNIHDNPELLKEASHE